MGQMYLTDTCKTGIGWYLHSIRKSSVLSGRSPINSQGAVGVIWLGGAAISAGYCLGLLRKVLK
jgi:hypothetical protein